VTERIIQEDVVVVWPEEEEGGGTITTVKEGGALTSASRIIIFKNSIPSALDTRRVEIVNIRVMITTWNNREEGMKQCGTRKIKEEDVVVAGDSIEEEAAVDVAEEEVVAVVDAVVAAFPTPTMPITTTMAMTKPQITMTENSKQSQQLVTPRKRQQQFRNHHSLPHPLVTSKKEDVDAAGVIKEEGEGVEGAVDVVWVEGQDAPRLSQ